MNSDIKGRQEVEQLVNIFYDYINADPELGAIFNQRAQVNWAKHLPVMYDFWETLLFGKTAYKGLPFPKHLTLDLRQEHFERWLHLFFYTVDNHFSGPFATEAKNKALNIASVFQVRLGLKPAAIKIIRK